MSDWTDPDVEELTQQEAPPIGPIVPVEIVGPVKAQQLPAQTGSAKSFTVTDVDAVKVTKQDPRRSRLRVWTTTQPIYVGYTQGEALGTQAAVLPIDMILEISNLNEVWVRCATPAQSTVVSALNDQWTQ